MSSLNHCVFIGNLGADPELKTTNTGKSVVSFSIAVTEKYKETTHTEWVRVVAWEKLADNCAKFLAKGRPVCVEGKMVTRTYEDKQGVKRYATEIVARNVVFLGGGEKKEDGQKVVYEPGSSEDVKSVLDSIPF